MEAIISIKKTFEVKTLEVKAKVRYWEDAEINGVSDENGELTPCRVGEMWCPIIDIDAGKILNWEEGKRANIHFKVCDCCGWDIKDEQGASVLSSEDGYVPDTLCPEEEGYGDYIIMSIDEKGVISNWEFNIDDFQNEEE